MLGKSLRARLFFWMLGGTGIIFLFTFVMMNSFAQRSTHEHVLNTVRSMSDAYANKVSTEFAHSYAAAESLALAVYAVHQQNADRSTASAINRMLLIANPQFVGIGSYWEPNAFDHRDTEFANVAPEQDATGRYLPYWNRANGSIAVEPVADYEMADWYSVPKTTRQPWATEPYEFPIAGRAVLMVSLMVPILADNGDFLGAVGADYPLQRLQQMLSEVKLFNTGYANLISNQGLYASHLDSQLLGKSANDLPSAALDAVKNGQAYEYIDDEGLMHLIRPITPGKAPNSWALQLVFPFEVAMADVQKMSLLTAVIGVAGLLVLAILIWSILTRIVSPLKTLAQEMADWNGDVSYQITVVRQDEIGVIGMAFNTFMSRLRELVQAIVKESRQLDTTAQELNATNINVAQQSQQQLSAANDMRQEMDSMVRSINEIAQQANLLQELAQDTGHVTTTAAKTVTQTAEEIGQINQTMQAVALGVQRLDDRSREISNIVNVIREIAEQTNLLALNAAIEAARAGEQGRGFAVVADEVRKLANRTAQATGEIANTITTIQKDSATAVKEVRTTSEQVNQGVELSRAAATAIETIRVHADEMLERIAAVVAQANQQSNSSQALTYNVDHMDTLANASDRSIQLTQEQVQGLIALAKKLNGLVSQFRS